MSTSGVLRVLFRDNYSDSLTTPASVFGFLFIKKMCSKVGMLVKEKSKLTSITFICHISKCQKLSEKY